LFLEVKPQKCEKINALENPFKNDLDPDQILSQKMDLDPNQILAISK